MSQKLKNINLYLPHERERTSGSPEKQTFHIFWALLKLPFNIVDLYLERLLPAYCARGSLVIQRKLFYFAGSIQGRLYTGVIG